MYTWKDFEEDSIFLPKFKAKVRRIGIFSPKGSRQGERMEMSHGPGFVWGSFRYILTFTPPTLWCWHNTPMLRSGKVRSWKVKLWVLELKFEPSLLAPVSVLFPLATTLYHVQSFPPVSVLNSQRVRLCAPSLGYSGGHEINARIVQVKPPSSPHRLLRASSHPWTALEKEVRSLLAFFSPPQNGLKPLCVSYLFLPFFPNTLSSLVLSSIIHFLPTPTNLFLQNNLYEHPYTLLFTSFQHWLCSHFCPLHSYCCWFHQNRQHKQLPEANIFGAFPQEPSPFSSYTWSLVIIKLRERHLDISILILPEIIPHALFRSIFTTGCYAFCTYFFIFYFTHIIYFGVAMCLTKVLGGQHLFNSCQLSAGRELIYFILR